MAVKKKYPKKPKAKASSKVLQNYIDKCKAVDKHNSSIVADEKKRLALKSKIAKM